MEEFYRLRARHEVKRIRKLHPDDAWREYAYHQLRSERFEDAPLEHIYIAVKQQEARYAVAMGNNYHTIP